jgi:hypothetical protein
MGLRETTVYDEKWPKSVKNRSLGAFSSPTEDGLDRLLDALGDNC